MAGMLTRGSGDICAVHQLAAQGAVEGLQELLMLRPSDANATVSLVYFD